MKNFGLSDNILKATMEVLQTSKPDVPLQERIIRNNMDGKKEVGNFTSAYLSVVSEERKKEAERQAKFAAEALKSHLRMGKSVVEQTTPKTPREKDLAAKKHPKDKITHADVLKARGVIESLEEVVENKLVPMVIRASVTKRMSIPVEEQKEVVGYIAREFVLSLKEALNNLNVPASTINAIVEDFNTIFLNSSNIGIALDKINEAQKVMGIIKRNMKEPKVEKPAAKEDLNKMTKMEEVRVDEAVLDTPGNGYEHQCAVHVKHSRLGEGRTLFSQHADPAKDGSIAWYDVMFEHGIEKKVPTSELEILVSESHMNHKKKKK